MTDSTNARKALQKIEKCVIKGQRILAWAACVWLVALDTFKNGGMIIWARTKNISIWYFVGRFDQGDRWVNAYVCHADLPKSHNKTLPKPF